MFDTYLGRKVKETISFKEQGTFQSKYAAEKWLKENGYESGSSDRGTTIAITKGEYDLPQKWRNFDKEDKALIDGVMFSYDWREGEVTVLIFESKIKS